MSGTETPRRSRSPEPRWGVVSTVKAPVRQIAGFAAYHLDLGASAVLLYLDDPSPETAEILTTQRRVRVISCDDTYWSRRPKKARQTHQLRQAFNASRAYRRTRLSWLAHIDVDEYLILPRSMPEMLSAIPADSPYLRLPPAELLAQPDPWTGTAKFKLTRKQARQKKSALTEIYPEFGAYVPEGFFSYTGGKNIVRTGMPDIRVGIHAVLQNGEKLRDGHQEPGAYVGHAHAPDWPTFQRHLGYRLRHGSYRKKDKENMKLQDVLELIQEQEGTPGLKRFYNEMCAATPRLLAQLEAHDMLVTARLDLDQKIARWFPGLGEMP